MAKNIIPLTAELRQSYIEVIHKIQPALSNFTADDVTEEVANHMDSVLNSIVRCSNQMALVHELFEEFYMPFKINKWRKLIKKVSELYQDWRDRLEEQPRYKSCIATAALNWRSTIEMALMGM